MDTENNTFEVFEHLKIKVCVNFELDNFVDIQAFIGHDVYMKHALKT